VLALQTAGTTAVTVDASQNVGIGTASPQSLLDLTGNDPTLRLTDNGGSPTATFSMRSADAAYRIRDVTNSTDRLTINANGAIALSGASISATGVGITFPATQSASTDVNTLDDYEEGTWTPVITGTSTAGTASYSSQSGTYVKIGRYVFLQMFVVFTSTHTGTGGTKVGGFPFTIGANFGGGGTITYKTAWVTNGPDFMQCEATTTFGYLRYDTNTTQADIAPNVNIQNTTGFMLSIWYLSDN